MVRWRVLSGLVTLAVLVSVGTMFRANAAGPFRSRGRSPATSLEIFYSSPVLVRAGERVRMPIDVVCASSEGRACSSTVTLGIQVGSEPWRLISAPSSPGLRFDLTGPAMRAVANAPSGAVNFFIQARDESGRAVSLPPQGMASPLRFFVTRAIRIVRTPGMSFGGVDAGATALFVPWGSGSLRSGIEVGQRSATLGPSSFDVDARGRVTLMDSLQERLATFERGRLVRSLHVGVGARALLAVGSGGSAFVLDRIGSSLTGMRVGASGAELAVTVGSGIPAAVRQVNRRAFALVLPLDAWVRVPDASSREGMPASVGLPTGHGTELIRVGSDDRVRLGLVAGDVVRSAVELTPPHGLVFGEVALAESDGRGGYWLAVRVVRHGPHRHDQFEIVHVRGGRVLTAFATTSHSYALVPPLARFVLGKDGQLYQMTSSPEGIRVLRFDLKEE